ncbi:MAG: hypothetical protein A2Z77_00580 [Chloroflexi bacterium RBG_13_51_36]|nr:MAG: hypothetical protein A2Z77_00580 [Chloroflexi bacterium RBG_13_51_36]
MIRPAKLLARKCEYLQRVEARSKPKRKVPVWDWEYNGEGGALEAWTRSEARAVLKVILGKKLPKEVQLASRTE